MVIRVGEVRVFGVVEVAHHVQLAADLGLDFLVNFVEEGRVHTRLLAQHEQHGALNIVTLFDADICLRRDAPSSADGQASRPQD